MRGDARSAACRRRIDTGEGERERARAAPILEARNIVKTYGHVNALQGANFTVYPGEVVALIGDNGAGKSTLTKIISGVIRPDSGELLFEGTAGRDRLALGGAAARHRDRLPGPGARARPRRRRQRLHGPRAAQARTPRQLGVLDKRAMKTGAEKAFADLGVAVKDADAAVAYLSGGQRQGVAVARAASWASRVIIMDEPTAALGVVQTENVLNVIRRVRDSGVAVVLISHNMPDVLKVADRIEVLRLGRRVATFRKEDATLESLVGAMTGAVVQEGGSMSSSLRARRARARRAPPDPDAAGTAATSGQRARSRRSCGEPRLVGRARSGSSWR